jgi:hypothetical protein
MRISNLEKQGVHYLQRLPLHPCAVIWAYKRLNNFVSPLAWLTTISLISAVKKT